MILFRNLNIHYIMFFLLKRTLILSRWGDKLSKCFLSSMTDSIRNVRNFFTKEKNRRCGRVQMSVCVNAKKAAISRYARSVRYARKSTVRVRRAHVTLEKYPCRSWRESELSLGAGPVGPRLIYESGPASSSSYLFVCGLVVTPRAAGPRATYNDIFVSEMSHGHFLLIFAHGGTADGRREGGGRIGWRRRG